MDIHFRDQSVTICTAPHFLVLGERSCGKSTLGPTRYRIYNTPLLGTGREVMGSEYFDGEAAVIVLIPTDFLSL